MRANKRLFFEESNEKIYYLFSLISFLVCPESFSYSRPGRAEGYNQREALGFERDE